MTTILIKDALRQSVEAASGGLQTVLYTAKGQPSFMNIIEKFDLSVIDPTLSGTHPAFIINGVEVSRILVGTYTASLINGELLSLPNRQPSTPSLAAAVTAARAGGDGFHVMTNAEWSAVQMQCYALGFNPKGNNYYGRDVTDSTQYGRRVDGVSAAAGIATGTPTIYTGSGPVSFRHNNAYNGISDVNGNVNLLTPDVRLCGATGELHIFINNNAAMRSADLSATSAGWKAINAVTGELMDLSYTGTPGVDFVSNLANSVKILNVSAVGNNYTLTATDGAAFSSMANAGAIPVSATALAVLKKYGLYPLVADAAKLGSDKIVISATPAAAATERMLRRQGTYSDGPSAGVWMAAFNGVRAASGVSGFRVAYYA
ncbi:TPA: hypothetical protein MJB68_24665 [Klebsiella pneumoniae]|uniref:hypothetical protein n=1 Tax=Klebsiella pneumoniae TaxID=573 RepID=UPI00069A668B|nr:hypothetical protein [Klebsiella pneumoniae]ALR25972.1 hypothetical protein AGG09_17630 [Klebsiella pneumoniae]EJI7599351.1 hypothetical protein [Klebsiella pneumoniae]EKX4680228.1 hypothetical protein [Klebsiella pneumoniae]EKZ5670523.1 hypothetical protein [Klebsiella pneumoniae]EKZ6785081.1 hypothetical protein [Klebsiella pneumoniae]